MGILRSEEMKHGTLVLPADDRARHLLDAIGGPSTKIHFEDMNSRSMHRPYKKYIQRLDEMERIMRFLTDELKRIPDVDMPPTNVDNFLETPPNFKLDEVEANLKRIYSQFHQFRENNSQLLVTRNAALEERFVMEIAEASYRPSLVQERHDQRRGQDFEHEAAQHLLSHEGGSSERSSALDGMLTSLAGVIPQSEQHKFARTIFRVSRGNTFTHLQAIPDPIPDPNTGAMVFKSVFVIYFQGFEVSAMSQRIRKICSSFGVKTYHWPVTGEEAQDAVRRLKAQERDHEHLVREGETFIRGEVSALLRPARVGGNAQIEDWRCFCVKERSIYTTLNMFEGSMQIRANCWYPAVDEEEIRRVLSESGGSCAAIVPDHKDGASPKNAPTYIRKNQFTGVFQELIDTYGLPRYQEANPALLTLVTFPFLFGVMYGDIGHGLMLFSFGAYAVWQGEALKHSLPALFQARYIIFMMGFFAIYVGFLYNDFFSIGLTLFPSRWEAPAVQRPGEVVTYNAVPSFDTLNEGGGGPYPFGVDPAWHGAQNELTFLNSLKMKISVILGVTQMTVGLLMRFSNACYERSKTDFLFECVPMMVFMVCFFGYMDYMILYKWVHAMPKPPSIINSMIAMAMWSPDPNPMFGEEVSRNLMAVTMLSVPFLLFPKPLIQLWQHRQEVLRRTSSRLDDQMGGGGGHVDKEACYILEDEAEKFEFGEIVIHQVIETIEYVLGTVSHTASYLRLWALSLAHQQLSLVFFKMTILSGMEAPFPMNILAIYFWFAIWFLITVGILLGMDVLECFLHTLRLHWVEFQSKFYRADGYAFEPFCHRTALEKQAD